MTMSRLSPIFDVDDCSPGQTPEQQERMVITPTHSMASLSGSLTSSASSAHASYVASMPLPFRYVDPSHPALHGSLTPPASVTGKVLNFSPEPTNLPPAVEAEVQRRAFPQPHELRLGSMAQSHRSPEFGAVLENALRVTREVMRVPPEYEILFAQGGGHGQFAAVPMNLCSHPGEEATYVVNGTWSKRAVEEASKYCTPTVISALNDDGSCTTLPSVDRIDAEINPRSKFLYVCSNETVNGLELHDLPRLASRVPLVVDASSDFTSKPIAWRRANVGILFACASKNIGHPGVTAVIIRRDLLNRANPMTPGILNYTTNLSAGNVWNTIPTFNVDVVGVMMEWLRDAGGMAAAEAVSTAKAKLIYDLIDNSNGFFGTPVDRSSPYRSRMNVPFCVDDGNEELTNLFLVEAWERGIVGLKTVTPFKSGKYLRASLYHGVSYDEARVLAGYMSEFMAKHAVRLPAARGPATSALSRRLASMVMSGNGGGGNSAATHVAPAAPAQVADDSSVITPPASLSSSPDSVADSTMTLPKNFKMNRYARLTADMFAGPSGVGSPPGELLEYDHEFEAAMIR
ncbi:hypothetical protein THAOC_21512 [Thalassiosira oceanica]|uniref:phosphoserine transaminase n=1 Tax=Thalassiosira oceanica TaxID=159749 RepID=K0RX69_THAOC|nr:hypothetical protein THAOC_21512 [Thalassiosira oceanica]|eukprot:EJK58373.1 hypothetical protein THAOC_21512 [Thalassiosira oceanica]